MAEAELGFAEIRVENLDFGRAERRKAFLVERFLKSCERIGAADQAVDY